MNFSVVQYSIELESLTYSRADPVTKPDHGFGSVADVRIPDVNIP